ncbi:PREDICTED: uncharacterized protein LOC108562932 [Nicrophorus vespilloides]|uniref:Odorant receptor n=1 Tax=Nicrophorus vespilloides TaxID=110193 RepID=A0ABM1MQT3_NICVS|nr:PREDICTED: uncharacterized protein LOC108562932 [Nicrophorus vespilloides]
MLFTLLLMIFLELALNWNGIETIRNVLYLPGISLVTVLTIYKINAKLIFLVINQKKIRFLLQRLEEFWPTDKYGESIQIGLQRMHDVAHKSIRFFVYVCVACICILSSAPFVSNKRALPFSQYNICNLETSPCFELLYAWQIMVTSLQILPITISFDGLFLSFILYAYIGIELIKNALLQAISTNANSSETRGNINEIVKQHSLILTFIKETNLLFSGLLMIQFSASLGMQIFLLFMLTRNGIPPDTEHISTYGFLYITFILQLSIYSIGGTMIVNQTKILANISFGLEWYRDGNTDLAKSLKLIILRSQNGEKMTIGNIFDLDLITFISVCELVLKTAFSIYTLLNTITA